MKIADLLHVHNREMKVDALERSVDLPERS